jgi:hypothetical protein
VRSSPQLEEHLKEFCAKGELAPRTERNNYLKISYCGAGKLISPKWNVKIYTSGAVVCNDLALLKALQEGSLLPAPPLPLIQIDDAGIGFPLCGAMVGITDGKQVWTDIIDASFFQTPKFEKQQYVTEYARKGLNLLAKIGIKPETSRIEICTGFINTRLKNLLREKGYDVRVTEIKGLLQDQLERLFREHVHKEIGEDLAYDPKELAKNEIGKKYYSVVNWARNHKPHLLKSGWGSMKCS